MLVVAKIVGLVAGLIVGVIVDEALFPETEWTSAIVVPLFAVAGWFAVGLVARRLRSGAANR